MKKIISIFIAISMIASIAYAGMYHIIFSWDKNTEADLAGYKLYHRIASELYTDSNALIIINDPNSNTCTLDDFVTNENIYFVITAFDIAGNESGYSNEVMLDIAPNAPVGFKIDVILEIHTQ